MAENQPTAGLSSLNEYENEYKNGMGKSKTELLSVINSYTVHFAEEKIDRPEAGSSKTNKYMPLAIASMAAMALGGMALFASAVPATKYLSQQSRAIKDSTSTLEQLQKSITKYECSNPPCVSK